MRLQADTKGNTTHLRFIHEGGLLDGECGMHMPIKTPTESDAHHLAAIINRAINDEEGTAFWTMADALHAVTSKVVADNVITVVATHKRDKYGGVGHE